MSKTNGRTQVFGGTLALQRRRALRATTKQTIGALSVGADPRNARACKNGGLYDNISTCGAYESTTYSNTLPSATSGLQHHADR
jgi:hypothetical protein